MLQNSQWSWNNPGKASSKTLPKIIEALSTFFRSTTSQQWKLSINGRSPGHSEWKPNVDDPRSGSACVSSQANRGEAKHENPFVWITERTLLRFLFHWCIVQRHRGRKQKTPPPIVKFPAFDGSHDVMSKIRSVKISIMIELRLI